MRTRDANGRLLPTERKCVHTDRPVKGNGLCGSCYMQQRFQLNPKARKNQYIRHLESGGAATANWKYKLKARGASEDMYNSTLQSQGGVCAICGRTADESSTRKKRLAFDHDHRTNQLRGLLCDACNRALGLFKDSVEMLSNAICYLEKHNALNEGER